MIEQNHLQTLLKKAQNGDDAARRTLIEENLGLVWCVVKRFTGRGVERDDLFQLGCIGLIKSIDRFDDSFNVRFSTYAVPLIIGEIRRYMRDDGSVKIARSLKELSWRVYRARDVLGKSLNHEPTLDELAVYLKVSKDEITEAVGTNNCVMSLQQNISWSEGREVILEDRIDSEKDETENVINRLLLKQLMDKLTREEQRIIVLRYYMDKTQTQVAQTMGISQVQVSRMEKGILRKLKRNI